MTSASAMREATLRTPPPARARDEVLAPPATTSAPASASAPRQRSAISNARSNRQSGRAASAAWKPSRMRIGVTFGSKRRAPARARRGCHRAHSSPAIGSSAQRGCLRVRDYQCARAFGPAEPLLAGDRVVVESLEIDRDDAYRLRAVDEDRKSDSALSSCRKHLAGRPQDVRERQQTRPPGVTASRIRSGSGGTTTTARHSVERPEETEVLVRRRYDLVVRSKAEPASTMLQPSVVDAVSETVSTSTPTRAATSARSSSRSARRRSNARRSPPVTKPELLGFASRRSCAAEEA